MSAGTRGNMTPTKKPDAEKRNAEREAALTFVRMAKEKGLDLTGPDGLPKQFTKSVLETALDEEMAEHLGRAKHKKSKDGRAANTRNGTTAKTVVTDSVGPVRIEVPRCFASMFVRQVRQCFSAVWADGFPRCRHRFPVM